MSKTCPQCKTENRDLARFCMSCNTPLQIDTPVHYCPSGRHPMDPGWDKCPYCENEAAGERGKRAVEPPPLPPPPSGSRRATVVESPAQRPPTVPESDRANEPPPLPPPPPGPGPRRAKTEFGPVESTDSPTPPAAQPGLRRIVAMLVTYTWRADGEIFPLREGRNYLGSAPECEVRVASDPQLSSRHATIVYRGKDFWINDENSMNGTFVNGEPADEKQRLSNYSVLKTGATVWHFISVAPSPES